MASITQDMKYRLSSTANTFTATNGVMTALWNRFRHPHQHTSAEIKLLYDTRRRNPDADLVVFWVKLRQRGAAPSPDSTVF